MDTKTPSTAKITRPKLSGVFRRDRLFRLLDKARHKPVTWVASQAGSGKTTLAASYIDSRKLPCLWYQMDEGDRDIASFFYYMGMAAKKAATRHKKALPLLTPEYLMGIPVFTRRYFEELFRRLKTPFVIVLDNYQDTPMDSDFHDMLIHGLDVVPDGITVLVLSRIDPPQQFVRLQANNRLHQIGWDDICFTRDETGELLKTHGRVKPTKETEDLLHNKTAGWAAGLMLLLEWNAELDSISSGQVSSAGLFDYFANEIFDKTGEMTQDVLLKTSFLQWIEPADAEYLTGNAAADQILERLSRSHYFTQKYDRAYQYHPLFREFLQSRAQNVLTPVDIARIQGSAALLLEQSGRLEEAIGLYIDAADWSEAERLLLAQAELFVRQGRSKTLEEWILIIQGEMPEDSPWLFYWFGVCRLAYNPAEAKGAFEKAFMRFTDNGDANGLFLAWSGVVDALVCEWGDYRPLDRWIEWLDDTYDKGIPLLSPEVDAKVAIAMFTGLVYRKPHHRDIEFWLDRSLSLALKGDDINLSLQACYIAANYFFWIGDFDRVIMVGSKTGDFDRSPVASPLHKIVWRFVDAANDLCFASSVVSALTKLNNAIKIADETGVQLWSPMLMALGVYSSNLQGDIPAAEEFLKKMQPLLSNARPHTMCQYHSMHAWCFLLRGDIRQAVVHAKIALNLAEETGFIFPQIVCLLALANISQTNGQYGKARLYLDRAEEMSSKTRSPLFQFACLLLKARIDLDAGREEEGLRFLADAMQIGREKGYLGPPWWWQPSVMSFLCGKAMEYGIETEYVMKLIRLRNLVPDKIFHIKDWPYPVKIYTFGGFKLYINDKPVEFIGKVQKKPLEMLKTLIALGGKDIAEELLIDLLWPDADADSAHKSHEMTLLRLRRLLGVAAAVQFKGGLVTLDPRYCWVDVWAMEDIFSKTVKVWKTRSASGTSRDTLAENIRLTEKAIKMYNGDFLESDSHQAWAMREKMKSRMIFLISALGGHWEQTCQWNKALECFQKGLDIDDLTEEFYQHMMACYEKLGQKAEAVKVYKKCSSVLLSVLGITPSGKTEAIYTRIKNKR